MALYISTARRTRRTIITAVAVGLVALALGWLIGRQQVPSIDSRVDDVKVAAGDAATAIERLDIEYEQVLAGSDSLESSVLVPLDELRTDLQATMDRAPWLGSERRATVLEAIAAVRQAATAGVPLDDLRAQLASAAAVVRTAFALE
jgi:hypothetical protein